MTSSPATATKATDSFLAGSRTMSMFPWCFACCLGMSALINGWFVVPTRAQEPPGLDQARAAEASEIVKVLELQTAAWNRGDLLEFMDTYWRDDRLTFSGGGQTMRGWQATLERYQKSYPREKMGQLTFAQVECDLLAADAALVLGTWRLDVQGARKEGNFTLVLRKFAGRWLIIHDHSSTLVLRD
jgi:ketosteroid isomerase-like protein